MATAIINKSCPSCKKSFPASEFYKNRSKPDGLSTQCKTCRGQSSVLSSTVEYKTYLRAKHRCTNAAYYLYEEYGGRGIEFRFTSFKEFYEEIGPRPSQEHSLDRIDVNGHYEKGNVRWASRLTQGRNKRNSLLLTYNGHTDCLTAWAERIGILPGTLRDRLYRGWCDECTITIPLLPLRLRSTQECTHKQALASASALLAEDDLAEKIRKVTERGDAITGDEFERARR